MSDYKYARTNSKGEVVLRRDTEEDFSFVVSYLKEKDIPYEYRDGAHMFILTNSADVRYVYYWTTGRWSIKKRTIDKHYSSKGIDDFVTRFFNKYADDQIAKRKEWDEEKRIRKELYAQRKKEKLEEKYEHMRKQREDKSDETD